MHEPLCALYFTPRSSHYQMNINKLVMRISLSHLSPPPHSMQCHYCVTQYTPSKSSNCLKFPHIVPADLSPNSIVTTINDSHYSPNYPKVLPTKAHLEETLLNDKIYHNTINLDRKSHAVTRGCLVSPRGSNRKWFHHDFRHH